MGVISALFGATVESLVLKDSPICAAVGGLLRCYLVAAMPKLLDLNDSAVTPEERATADRLYRPLLELQLAPLAADSSSAQPLNSRWASNVPAGAAVHPPQFGGISAASRHSLRTGKPAAVTNKVESGASGAVTFATADRPPSLLSDMSRSALYHRQIRADFESAFEMAVRSTVRQTIIELQEQHAQNSR